MKIRYRGNVTSLANAIEKWFSENRSREEIREACYSEIDTSWNPYFQIEVLKRGLEN